MKFFTKIDNVSSVKALNDNVYYCKENALFDSTENYVLNNVECQSFWFDKFYIFYHTNDGEFRLFNLENKKNGIIDFAPNLNNEDVVFVTYDHNFCLSDLKTYYKNAKYNLKSNSYIQKYENIDNERVIYSNDKLFITFTTYFKIHAYTLPTAQPLWQFDLGVLGTFRDSNGETKGYEVRKFVGVWENELLVACNNHTLLSIDIETGKLLYKWQDFNGYELYPGKELLPEPSTFVLDAENKQMISLYGSYYIEIELKTRQIQITEVKDSFEKYNIISFRKSSDYSFDKTHIYTIAEMDISKLGINWIQRCIIAVNRKTKEIDWQYVFEDVTINTDIPQLVDNKLYQLDGNHTLHIFQKENPSI